MNMFYVVSILLGDSNECFVAVLNNFNKCTKQTHCFKTNLF